jgi:hypothetical protein
MTEPLPGPSGPASVVLDIGPGVGALILYAPPALDGVEIEISPNGSADAPRTHSRVRERRAGATAAYAAVYPGLRAGGYTIWAGAITPIATVTIISGRVSRYDWPAGPGAVRDGGGGRG